MDHPQTILAWGRNGAEMSREEGAPLRLYSAIKLGYKMVKWVDEIVYQPVRTRRILGGSRLRMVRRSLTGRSRCFAHAQRGLEPAHRSACAPSRGLDPKAGGFHCCLGVPILVTSSAIAVQAG